MRHVTLTTFAVATALVAIVACEQQAPDRSNPTAPDEVSFARSIGGTCDAARLKLITTQQTDLWAKPYLDTAKTLFAAVTATCPTPSSNVLLTYIDWTISHRSLIIAQATGTASSNLIFHWNTAFPYAGLTGLDAPTAVPTTIFTDTGVVAVVPNPADSIELAPVNHLAAMTIYHQNAGTGDQRTHLFVIYPLNSNCLSGSNLHQFGPCYEFAAFPHVYPAFDPKVKVGVCQPLNSNENLPYGAPALGHFTGSFVEIPNQTAYPTFCTHLDNIADAGSWTGGFSGIAKRVAFIAKRTFGVQSLYAVHGGLGGLGGGISPFGGVNLEVFHATFSNETVGTQPTTPEVGTWNPVTVTPPGTVLVQSFLGADTTTGNVLVLNQAGGACRNCGGLLVQGNLYVEPGNPAAHNGTYETTFLALQDNANMKSATFKLRDSNNHVLAQVSFVVQSNTNKVLFNGNDTGVRWVRHIPIAFKIDTNLDDHTTSLWMDNVSIFTDVAFMSSTTNFTNVAADFGGIDSGVMGWDEIRVVRLQDN